MSKRKLFLGVIMLINTTIINAQTFNYGLTLNFGISQVTSNFPISGDYKVKFTISGNVGGFFEKRIGMRSFIGGEILWIQIEGKEVTNNKVLTAINGQGMLETVGMISDISKLHSSYFGLPIYYKINFNKIGIKFGFQTMIFLFANSNYEASGKLNGKPFQNKGETNNIKFDLVDFGPKIGTEYELNSKLNLRADFYLGIPDITSKSFPWERRNRQITLGINYLLTKNKN